MQTLPIFQADAFTGELFRGNPAAVVPLEAWLPDETLQAIAFENNLSETAFFVPGGHDGAEFHLRWCTPRVEVALCGHATLAAAHTLWAHLGFPGDTIRFSTNQRGVLSVTRECDEIVLDFPAATLERIESWPELDSALGKAPKEIYRGIEKTLAVFDNKRDVHELAPDFRAVAELDSLGVIVTAPGAKHDFISRFFAPYAGIDEDPVTGSAHTVLTPYWAARLGRDELSAHQVSSRGGFLRCAMRGDRVQIAGRAVTYLEGTIRVPAITPGPRSA